MLLVNFTFENCGSFRDEQAFTMSRIDVPSAPDASGAEDGAGGWTHPTVSTAAAVYGANASGKSRFLRALAYVSRFVRTSFDEGDADSGTGVTPFLLDVSSRDKPSSFFVEFIADDGLRYKYWFTVDATQVRDEMLSVYRTRQPSLLYARSMGEDGAQSIEFGASFKGAKRQAWEITRRNSLLLSAAAKIDNKTIMPAYRALGREIAFYNASAYNAEIPAIKQDFERNTGRFEVLSELLSYADVGITGMRVQRRSVDDGISALMGALVQGMDGNASPETIAALTKEMQTELAFRHRGADTDEWLPMQLESDGTIAALSFMSVALLALASGCVALVDEIDKSLHPVLVRELVGLFVDPATNPHQAQLIFTTHDGSLIDESGGDRLLHRDQVWLTQKAADGASELIAITEYGLPRKAENIGRNYMHGVYGAIPLPTLHLRVAQALARLDGDGGATKDPHEVAR
ncbi:ATP-binding protein [bacterium]|nr:ATP-binding protein [bacterium]